MQKSPSSSCNFSGTGSNLLQLISLQCQLEKEKDFYMHSIKWFPLVNLILLFTFSFSPLPVFYVNLSSHFLDLISFFNKKKKKKKSCVYGEKTYIYKPDLLIN